MINKTKILSEDAECELLVMWLKSKHYKFTHISNETFTKSWRQKLRNKRLGVSRGFPDYFIIAENVPFFIEMKRIKGGQTSNEQKIWIDILKNANLNAKVCKGFKEAKQFIQGVLN